MKLHQSIRRAFAFTTAFILTTSFTAASISAERGTRNAEAEPVDPPTFTNPLTITNPFFPFQRGGLKMFTGSDQGNRAVALDLYLLETRQFTWNGATVECAILREVNFDSGELVESTDNYFAESDDGTMYYFGEVVDNYENGVIVNHNGSWLVGGPTRPTDPADTGNAPRPAVFMPSNPELGDMFKPEDLFPIVDETAEILAVGKTLRVPAARYTETIKVKETTRLNSDVGFKWYARTVGVVQASSKGEILRLVASTLVQTP